MITEIGKPKINAIAPHIRPITTQSRRRLNNNGSSIDGLGKQTGI